MSCGLRKRRQYFCSGVALAGRTGLRTCCTRCLEEDMWNLEVGDELKRFCASAGCDGVEEVEILEEVLGTINERNQYEEKAELIDG